jgi:hypothetical protein
MTYSALGVPGPKEGAEAPQWLRVGVPLTLLLDLACLSEPGYPAILGQALAREGADLEPAVSP